MTFFRRISRPATILSTLGAVAIAVPAGADGATAKSASVNPASNCIVSASVVVTEPLKAINSCRAHEGIRPMVLPKNWSRLSRSEQLLTVIDLERTSRGEAPIAGLTPELNRLAETGARHYTDPPFPSGGFERAGGVWSGTSSVLVADYGWMYSDGYGGQPFVRNLDCTSPSASGCWGHRDNILMPTTRAVGGAAYSSSHGGSYAFEVVADVASVNHLKFSWKQEQRNLG